VGEDSLAQRVDREIAPALRGEGPRDFENFLGARAASNQLLGRRDALRAVDRVIRETPLAHRNGNRLIHALSLGSAFPRCQQKRPDRSGLSSNLSAGGGFGAAAEISRG